MSHAPQKAFIVFDRTKVDELVGSNGLFPYDYGQKLKGSGEFGFDGLDVTGRNLLTGGNRTPNVVYQAIGEIVREVQPAVDEKVAVTHWHQLSAGMKLTDKYNDPVDIFAIVNEEASIRLLSRYGTPILEICTINRLIALGCYFTVPGKPKTVAVFRAFDKSHPDEGKVLATA